MIEIQWQSPFMNKLQQDLTRAAELADFASTEGDFYREDARGRIAEIQQMQGSYRVAGNNVAAQELQQYVDQLVQACQSLPNDPNKGARGLLSKGLALLNRAGKSDAGVAAPAVSLEERVDDSGVDRPEGEQVGHLIVHPGGSEYEVPQVDDVVTDNDTSSVVSDDTESGSGIVDVRELFGDSKILDILLNYATAKGVIGEQNNLVLGALCLANGLHFGIEGPSGSGKTYVANTLIGLLDEGDVYALELATEAVLMNDVDRINETSVLYIPELQKPYKHSGRGTPMIAEIVKTLTEGRDAVRKVREKVGVVGEYTISAGIAVVYTLADENAFKKDQETARRFLRLQTDTSEEHKEAIRQAKGQAAFDSGEDVVVANEQELRQYMAYMVHHHDEFRVRDPFAPAIADYIPLTQRSPSFQTHYNNLVAASAIFNHNRRLVVNEGGSGENLNTVFTSLEDHRLVFSLYHAQMLAAMEQIDQRPEDVQKIAAVRERLEKEGGVNWDVCYGHAKQLMQDRFPSHLETWEHN